MGFGAAHAVAIEIEAVGFVDKPVVFGVGIAARQRQAGEQLGHTLIEAYTLSLLRLNRKDTFSAK